MACHQYALSIIKTPCDPDHISGYSVKEIASFIGISTEAAENRLRRARQLLKQELVTVIDEDLKANKLDERFTERIRKLIGQHYELSAAGKQLDSLSKARKALELDPENRWLKHILAGSLSRCGDVTGDLEYYRQAEALYLKIAPTLPSSYYELGILYTSLREFDKAIDCFKRLKDDNPDPSIEMARTYSQKGEYEYAAKLFEEASAHSLGNLCNGLQSLAIENRRLGSKDAAYRCINSLIGILEAVGPEPGVIGLHWAYCDLAEYQAEDGLKGAAIRSLEKAIDIVSENNWENASLLFPRVQFITSRFDERSELDCIVRDLTSGKCYKELQTMPEYHALVEKARSLQKVCSTRSENKTSNQI